ncbi:MAG: WecB/TagA/CpsF family glycosyltransferase [Burkholderiaceae bacterium]
MTTPDFYRRVYCVMGLPIDAHTVDSARSELIEAVRMGRRYVMVTPNANFVAICQRDSAFRDSLLKSDVSLADGAPLIALARIAGIPIHERVAGSSLFESLCRHRLDNPVTVFLFGESNGIPERAQRNINGSAQGVVCNGWYEPEYGSAEDLSTPEIRRAISSSRSDFLVVALGAQKGQRWIDKNIELINTPAVCHLGAVMKMTAGIVRRAPSFMQKLGLEWLWRIIEEPALWRRYRDDALTITRLLVTRLIPLALHRSRKRLFAVVDYAPQLRRIDDSGVVQLRLRGTWRVDDTFQLRGELTDIAESGKDVELDLADTSDMDSGVVGLLLILRGHCMRIGARMTVVGASWRIRNLLYMMCADYLLDPVIGTRSLAPVVAEQRAVGETETTRDVAIAEPEPGSGTLDPVGASAVLTEAVRVRDADVTELR